MELLPDLEVLDGLDREGNECNSECDQEAEEYDVGDRHDGGAMMSDEELEDEDPDGSEEEEELYSEDEEEPESGGEEDEGARDDGLDDLGYNSEEEEKMLGKRPWKNPVGKGTVENPESEVAKRRSK